MNAEIQKERDDHYSGSKDEKRLKTKILGPDDSQCDPGADCRCEGAVQAEIPNAFHTSGRGQRVDRRGGARRGVEAKPDTVYRASEEQYHDVACKQVPEAPQSTDARADNQDDKAAVLIAKTADEGARKERRKGINTCYETYQCSRRTDFRSINRHGGIEEIIA